MKWGLLFRAMGDAFNKIPLEKLVVHRDPAKEMEELRHILLETPAQAVVYPPENPQAPDYEVHRVRQELEPPGEVVTRPGVDAERMAWQAALVRGELWLLEGHLKNRCIGCGGDVECCLPPGAKVYGKERLYPIERTHYRDNARDRLVFTGKGRLRKVAQYHSHPYAGELIELQCWYTNIPLQITPNHLALAVPGVRVPQTSWRQHGINEAKATWTRAEELSDHDFIAFPRIKETRDIGVISEGLAELLGWYVAEGTPGGSGISFSLGKHEREKAQRVADLIGQCFGIKASITEKATAQAIWFHSATFAPLFKQFGHGALNKKLPSWFLYLPEHKQYSFLRGAIGGDGHPDKFSISYATSAETLAYQLRLLLFRLGLLHSLTERNVPDSVIDGRTVRANGNRYDLIIAGDAARSLAQGLGIEYDGGNRTSGNFGWVSENYVFIPIKATRAIPYKGRVYNIGVEEDESYLTVHGALHNCWKHSTNLIDAGRETMSMSSDPLYREAAELGERIRPLMHPEDVKAGTYADRYPTLAVQVSELRTRFDAKVMSQGRPAITLDEAKKMAAQEAAREVERRWESEETGGIKE